MRVGLNRRPQYVVGTHTKPGRTIYNKPLLSKASLTERVPKTSRLEFSRSYG
jgi:hypothetical protein